ncbi:MAG: hypothetical protein ACRD5Z_00060 [Bryobacteraceae bacterium]
MDEPATDCASEMTPIRIGGFDCANAVELMAKASDAALAKNATLKAGSVTSRVLNGVIVFLPKIFFVHFDDFHGNDHPDALHFRAVPGNMQEVMRLKHAWPEGLCLGGDRRRR